MLHTHPNNNSSSRLFLKKKTKIKQNVILFRRSLIYQVKEFFQNSTLHGVRYIAENGRPAGERFMWFCFTAIGAVTALVIIMSLWEKFQTNPTITGLDTDFHNQQVMFPTTILCPERAYDEKHIKTVASELISQSNSDAMESFLKILTKLSFDNIREAYDLSLNFSPSVIGDKSLRELAFEVAIQCPDILKLCKYRDEEISCCSHFDPVYTEHGFCFGFNTRFKSLGSVDEKTLAIHDLYETDKKWALYFVPADTSRIFIFSHQEYFGWDFKSQLIWDTNQIAEILISKKNTYTTDDARQLSIGQRKCIFSDEIQLTYFKDDYTFSACMKECRMKKALKFCKCLPPFFMPVPNVPYCKVEQLLCLASYKDNITNIKDCLQCELSCSKTVYNIEKLNKIFDKTDQFSVNVEFLTWPIIRYKREVLFGWVDLLVSFGGIAGLFLGFSLLSGVEIIYYFTMRACCMMYRNRDELYAIEEEIRKKPPPCINMSIKPFTGYSSSGLRRRSMSLPLKLNTSSKPASEKSFGLLLGPKFGSEWAVPPAKNNSHSKRKTHKDSVKPKFRKIKVAPNQQYYLRSSSEPPKYFDYIP